MSRRLALAVLWASTALLGAPLQAQASFGFLPGSEGFSAAAKNENATATKQAGAHPYAFTLDLGLNSPGGASEGDLRSLRLSLPPGLLLNPSVVGECTALAFATHRVSPYEESKSGESCPDNAQIGVIAVKVGSATRHFGLFNLLAPFGSLAAIGASPFGVPLLFNVHLHEPDNLELELREVPQAFDLQGMELTIWGAQPWALKHDTERGNCLNETEPAAYHGEASSPGPSFNPGTCTIGTPEYLSEWGKSYLTLPTTPCAVPPAFSASATSWQGEEAGAEATIAALEKCNKALTTPKVQLMTDVAAARTGMAFNLDVNDGGGIKNPGGIARPVIKQAILTLPEGLTINPSLGSGLGVCSEAQFAAETAFSEPGAGCPNNSKIGNVALEGALALTEPLKGSLYVAKPYENRFGSLLALDMLVRLPRRGLIVKSVGKLEPDPHTGKLIATFDELPRLLYEHFALTLREGQRSTLVSPPTCGSYLSDLSLASWAEPTVFRHEASTLLIAHGEAGGPCPAGGIAPFAPGLLAGSINPVAAAYTPFYLRMTRSDGEQEITSYSASFPPGLLGNISGVTTCPDSAIAAAKEKTGAQELQAPSCPASSLIGHTIAGYGVGGTLAYAPGALYLGGPYHGSPLSTVAIDSATIGPFDLGTVIVRSAIRIDPRTAQASIDSEGSDPIPHILAGIPLHLRDIRVYVDRPRFTLNPTSCDPQKVASTLTGAGADLLSSADDQSAISTQRFQVLSCTLLGFKPRLSFALKGGSRRGSHPALKATYVPRPGDANLAAVSVTLPPQVFLAQSHIKTVCTRVQFRAANCPQGSIYGEARTTTPLMEEPLQGPVYLRASDHVLPDLVALLSGRGIQIEVVGRIDSSNGGIRATFSGLPDAPVSKFTMKMNGGRGGAVELAGNLCATSRRANARFIGQNSATEVTHPPLRVKCKAKGK